MPTNPRWLIGSGGILVERRFAALRFCDGRCRPRVLHHKVRWVLPAGDRRRDLDPLPKPVEFEGRLKDWRGEWNEVEACLDHSKALTDWKRVNASIVDISKARRPFPFRDPPSA